MKTMKYYDTKRSQIEWSRIEAIVYNFQRKIYDETKLNNTKLI